MRLRSRSGNSISAAVIALAALLVQACASSSSAPVMQQGSAGNRSSGSLPGSYVALERGIVDELNFARTVFGDEPAPRGETRMPERSRRYARALGSHRDDRIVEP